MSDDVEGREEYVSKEGREGKECGERIETGGGNRGS